MTSAPTSTDLHRQAMKLADVAQALRRGGRMKHAAETYLHAHERECMAAEAAGDTSDGAILWRSAAWLALDAGESRRALSAVGRGLVLGKAKLGTLEELRQVKAEALKRMEERCTT